MKSLLSAFFNVRLRRGVRAVTIDKRSILEQLSPVFAAAEALGFRDPMIRGGAVRDALLGGEINDYDLYVSRVQVVDGLELPSIKLPEAPEFYAKWLAVRLSISPPEPHTAGLTNRPYIAFAMKFAGIDHTIDLVINDEVLSPEMLALGADATMNGIAASRTKIAAHPRFLEDVQDKIYRPTYVTIGNLINAPYRYWRKFAKRNPKMRFRLF